MDKTRIARLIGEMETRPPRVVIFQTGVGTQALFSATDSLELTARFLAILPKLGPLIAALDQALS